MLFKAMIILFYRT